MLTNEEMRECRKRLEKWQTSSEMRRACDEIMHRMGADFFTQPGTEFLTQASAVISFAQHRGADAMRLIPANDQSPDFELQFGSRKEQWKFTEAGEPDRRYGMEYVESTPIAVAEKDFEVDPVATWIKRADAAPESIRARCAAKAEKHSSGWVRLLVYLNTQEYGIRQREIEASFPAATAPAKDVFSEVWVFWKERPYCVWRDGRLALEVGVGSGKSNSSPSPSPSPSLERSAQIGL